MKLERAVKYLSACRLVSDYHLRIETTGFIPSDNLTDLGEYFMHRRGSFLDLGAGEGYPTIIAAAAGMDAVGIELDDGLVRTANAHIATARENGWLAGSCAVVQGSYIPAEYARDWTCGAALACKHNTTERMLFVKGQKNLQELVGGLDRFDMWFAYPWPSQAPVLLELFSRYAKHDAVFAASRIFPQREMVEELGLRMEIENCIATIRRA